jgi:Icc protein
LIDNNRTVQVVQFTDTHFFSSAAGNLLGVDTCATFEQVRDLADRHNANPDLYLLTGDLSQDETAESYRRFASAVSNLKAPAYFVPGNHDVEERMESQFLSGQLPLRDDTEIQVGAWQFILLNTHAPGSVYGQLSTDELARLENCLKQNEHMFTMVVMHHHPIDAGSPWMDEIGLRNRQDFHMVLNRYANVRAVLFGHIHQQFDAMHGNIRYMGTPSTCVQFKPNSEKFAVDLLPPGYRWLELHPDGSLQTDVRRVANLPAGLDAASLGY